MIETAKGKKIYTEREQGYMQGREDAERSAWHIVKFHEITEEEREREGYPKEWTYILDCTMPNDGEEILIATRYKDEIIVDNDIALDDGADGHYLESGYDWIDIVAWRELPQFDEEWLKEKQNV